MPKNTHAPKIVFDKWQAHFSNGKCKVVVISIRTIKLCNTSILLASQHVNRDNYYRSMDLESCKDGTLLCETSNHPLLHSCSRLWWHLVRWSCSTWPSIQDQIHLNFHSLINNPLLHDMLPQGSMLMHYTFICHWDGAPKHRCVINVMPLVKSNGLSSTWSITS